VPRTYIIDGLNRLIQIYRLIGACLRADEKIRRYRKSRVGNGLSPEMEILNHGPPETRDFPE